MATEFGLRGNVASNFGGGATVQPAPPDNYAWFNPADAEIPDLSEFLEPLFYRIIVCPQEPKKKTKGGIILVDESQDNQAVLNYVGRVVALGESAFTSRRLGVGGQQTPTRYPEVGDWVVYARYGGQQIVYRGVRFLFLNDDDLIGITRDPENIKVYV